MVQRAKRRFFSLFSIVLSSILTLFSGAKSIQAQSDSGKQNVDFTTPSAWSELRTVAPSKAYMIRPDDQSGNKPSSALQSTQPNPSGTVPNSALKIHQSGTKPSDALASQQNNTSGTTPTQMAIRNQGAPSSNFPSQALKIHQKGSAGATPSGALLEDQGGASGTTPNTVRQVEQPSTALASQQKLEENTPSQALQFFARPNAAFKVHMNAPEESAFEVWLTQQGFQSQNLNDIELDAAFTEFRLEQIERRLDQMKIER